MPALLRELFQTKLFWLFLSIWKLRKALGCSGTPTRLEAKKEERKEQKATIRTKGTKNLLLVLSDLANRALLGRDAVHTLKMAATTHELIVVSSGWFKDRIVMRRTSTIPAVINSSWPGKGSEALHGGGGFP